MCRSTLTNTSRRRLLLLLLLPAGQLMSQVKDPLLQFHGSNVEFTAPVFITAKPSSLEDDE